ncbi:similar to Saccharomyces cerevisiae YCR054C CTR86 Essential protein of unknown function [Maudiozyma barnettii]|uniref:Ataxin-10 homolog n=1 Tax=Maudiozyma barnettii TaxID=61262 RepID=A0A8H2VBL7_9SACH|nr:Ctr86p [Kazachstania barnettii]CAB4252273.1 similar to Saccharomyces cerevisiae YCR054C CTR86 Essential protein of unknown function [Kazachstania barnettii]CAD1778965.1 similar to Saccharomyces cerevisiae YCR054C CTR86 Essential protein of unknown function [Kazachstania barnettii]
MSTAELSIISGINGILGRPPTSIESYSVILESLNPIVIKTAQDEIYRNELASTFKIWKELDNAIENTNVSIVMQMNNDEITFWYLRTLRGVLLLLRNLSASNQEIAQQLLIQNKVLRAFLTLCECNFPNIEMETSIYITTLALLHNLTKISVLFDKSMIDQLMSFLNYPLNHPDNEVDLIYPYLLFFENLAQSDDFLYYFFRHELKDAILYEFLMINIMHSHTHLFKYLIINDKLGLNSTREDEIQDIQMNMSNIDLAILRCFRKIIANESFSPYLLGLEKVEPKKYMNFLRIGQVVATSMEKWDKYELTGIMTWCFEIFDRTALEIEDYFEKGSDHILIATILHQKISSTLDIMSSFSRYEHIQKYILSYKGLDKLINLLGIFQKNLIRINFIKDKVGSVQNFKTSDSMGNKITDTEKINNRVDYNNFNILATNFPESKLLIVEILGNLCYKKTDMQDEIRLKHGLELILSNCVIDDNDPFIKERCITCIKFLLEGNEENQKFVAGLEAKRAADDDTLSEAGYQVDIDKNGEINLLPKKGDER